MPELVLNHADQMFIQIAIRYKRYLNKNSSLTVRAVHIGSPFHRVIQDIEICSSHFSGMVQNVAVLCTLLRTQMRKDPCRFSG
jgi:hypothetical protein